MNLVKKIAIDIDGTIADFTGPYIDIIRFVSGEPLPDYNYKNMPIWNVEDAVGVDKDVGSVSWEVTMVKNNWWAELPVIISKEEIDLIRKTSNEYQVTFLTARPKKIRDQTVSWIENVFGIGQHVVLVGGVKNKVQWLQSHKYDVIIDDRDETLILSDEAGVPLPIAIDRLYNRSWKGSRGATIKECLEICINTPMELLEVGR